MNNQQNQAKYALDRELAKIMREFELTPDEMLSVALRSTAKFIDRYCKRDEKTESQSTSNEQRNG